MSQFYDKFHKNLEIDSRKIDVSYVDSNKKISQARNSAAFLKNLSFKVTEEDLKNFFKDLSINKIEIVKNQRGISRGFAYIDFGSLHDLSAALEIQKGILYDREFSILKSDREITNKKESGEEKKLIAFLIKKKKKFNGFILI
jgi:RNA recognition motif-containing protein